MTNVLRDHLKSDNSRKHGCHSFHDAGRSKNICLKDSRDPDVIPRKSRLAMRIYSYSEQFKTLLNKPRTKNYCLPTFTFKLCYRF
jgi:hypothetical protein